jgi:DivIVA domain-containing protein
MDVPLTPMVVDVVTFDRAPLGRRGYNEDQVDDFLDRVQATLAGRDNLTAHEVRTAEFDSAPFIRRGYHEDQVDEFLDLVVEELDRREGNASGSGGHAGGPIAPGGHPAAATSSAIHRGAAHRGSTPTAGNVSTPGRGFSPSRAPDLNSSGEAWSDVPSADRAPIPSSGSEAWNGVPSAGRAPTAGDGPAPSRSGNTSGGVPSPGSSSALGNVPAEWLPFPPAQPRPVPPLTDAELTNPMLFAQPPSWPSPGTQPLKREAASGPPSSSVVADTGKTGTSGEASAGESPIRARTDEVRPSVAAGQAASALRAGAIPEGEPTPRTLADYAKPATPTETATQPAPARATTGPISTPAQAAFTPETATPAQPAPVAVAPKAPTPAATQAAVQPAPITSAQPTPAAEQQATGTTPPETRLPFPPAPPGEPGYAPADVAALLRVLTGSPDRERLARLTFTLTDTGGYHTATVDALRQAWLDALATKRP